MYNTNLSLEDIGYLCHHKDRKFTSRESEGLIISGAIPFIRRHRTSVMKEITVVTKTTRNGLKYPKGQKNTPEVRSIESLYSELNSCLIKRLKSTL